MPTPAAFERMELYGSSIDNLESGWLEALRIHASAKGRGMAGVIQNELIRRAYKRYPTLKDIYLSVGSGNGSMRRI